MRRVLSPLVVAAALAAGAVVGAGCGDDDGVAPSGAASPPAATPTPTPTIVLATPTAACPTPALPPGTDTGSAEIRYTESCRAFVRSPDAAFANLPDFPYAPRYATVDGMRMHYVDEGPADGQVVLLLHGQPAWAYLYRKMIPTLVAAGHRVIAVDHIGMGRSDKPVQLADYRYLQHVAWIEELIDVLGLEDLTLFCQDWGSLIGLRVVGDMPERFARVVVANGRLPVIPATIDLRQLYTVPDPPLPNPDAPLTVGTCRGSQFTCFSEWIAYALTNPAFLPSQIVPRLSTSTFSAAELAAYDAPFPERIYMAGVRAFPSLVVTLNERPTNEAARQVFDTFEKPLLTLFGRLDGNLGSDAVQSELRDTVPGAVGQPHHAYPDAHHFIQEDKGDDLARRVVEWMAATPP